MSLFKVTSFGQFEAWYSENQLRGYPKDKIAWCGSLSTFCVFFFSIFSGRWFDAHGPRLLIVVGTTTAVVALFCLACKSLVMSSSHTQLSLFTLFRHCSLQGILPVHPRTPALRYRRRNTIYTLYILHRPLVPSQTCYCCWPHSLRIRPRRRPITNNAFPPLPPNRV